jgi:beta-galactosidase
MNYLPSHLSTWPGRFLLLTLTLLATAPAARLHAANEQPRERLLFNADWRFQKDDPADVGDSLNYAKLREWVLPSGNGFVTPDKAKTRPSGEEPGKSVSYAQTSFNDQEWRKLNLPHDWAIEGPFKQELPGETGKLPYSGAGWYRKHFHLPATDQGKEIILQIDGAMSYSAVWLNGRFVGGWPYGYSSYQLDLTPFIRAGAENLLAIRLDNPNDSSRWYPGAGIYRNVWLVKTSPVHVAQWGTFVANASSNLEVHTTVRNDSDQPVMCNLTSIVNETNEKQKAQARQMGIAVPARGDTTVTQTIALAKGPGAARFWSTDDPYLYTLISRVEVANRLTDTYETPFGIRTARFDPDQGFMLNGEVVKINGVCSHADLGALGTVVNQRGLQRQIEILKEMGCNAIRTSHNMPAPELLDLCDRMGMLVMDESFDCWKRAKKPGDYHNLFDDWHEKDLRAEVRRDRNHPSVILYSIGNEIPEQGSPQGTAIGSELTAMVHEEDPTRPTTIACSSGGAGYSDLVKAVDVFGYNYKPGEYAKWHQTHPTQPLFGSETSSTVSSRGEYFFPSNVNQADFQVTSYDSWKPGWATLLDREFKGQDENPFVAGEFVWTGFDYLGEPTPYNSDTTNLLNWSSAEDKAKAETELKALGKLKVPSRSSYFGIVDLAGFKKDRFYLYQSRWRPELPMAHILPHWNWPERIGEVTPVLVYTSGDEAELFLNGKSLGKKKKGAYEYRLHWDEVKYEPGELKAVVYKNGRKWAADTVKTTGPASRLLLQPDRATIAANGEDLSFVTITVADKNGLLVPRSKNSLQFEVSGPGEIVATDNGDATDHTAFQSHERKAFNGLALAIIRGKAGQGGEIKVTARSDGLTPATATLSSH